MPGQSPRLVGGLFFGCGVLPETQAEGLVSVLGAARGKEVMPWVLARVSVYQDGIEDTVELTASLQSLSASTCWVVLMMGGGHFAGAVFRG